jgi:diguanylate cyclase (GGDEF)-like protein
MSVPDTVRDVIARIDAVVGMAGAIGGYRRDVPDERQEAQYTELVTQIKEDLARIREQTGAGLVNPNQHPSLRSFWAWVWAQDGGDRERKAAPRRLYEPLVAELTALAAGGSPDVGDAELGEKQHLTDAVDHQLEMGVPVTLVFIDLDGFKAVNDTLGHQEGDKCLEVVVGAVTAVVRGRGRVFRFGGDEFVALFNNATQAEGVVAAERIRARIEETASAYKVTASIGVAGTDVAGTDVYSLIGAADKAMYTSKQTGKNKVSVA